MSDDDLKEIKSRLAALEERTARFERIYGEWLLIEEWILTLPENKHRRPRDLAKSVDQD